MKTAPLSNPHGTLLLWIVMGYGVYFVVILGIAMLSFITSLFSFMSGAGFTSSDPLRTTGAVMATVGAVAAIIGWSVGYLQKLVIEMRLGWHAQGWVSASIAGSMLGVLAVAVVVTLFPRFTVENTPAYVMPIFILPVAICQWAVLRRAVHQAHLWVLANIAGGVSYAFVPDVFAGHALLIVLLAPLVQSALTGMMLIWLFERQRRHNRLAVAPVVARAKRPPSVWDEAI